MKSYRFPILVLIGLGIAMIFSQPPTDIYLENSFCPPFQSWDMPLGCDRMGRNISSMLIWGSFATLLLSIPARILTLVFSSAIALLAYFSGHYGRIFWNTIARVFLSLPSLLLGLLIASSFGSSVTSLVLAVVLSDWASVFSNLQGKIFEWEDTGYVVASYTFGASSVWVFRHHIFPSSLGLLKVQFQTGLPGVIMTLALFSYLGVNLGSDIFGPGLGEQISFSKDYFDRSPLSLIVPIIGISTLVGVLRIK